MHAARDLSPSPCVRFRASLAVVVLSTATSVIAVAQPLGIEVRATGNCPGSEAVTGELGRIAVATDVSASDHGWAEVSEAEHGVRVRLRDASGGTAAERVIEAGADCGERATAVAVVIASWQADLRLKITLELDDGAPSWFPSAGIAGVGAASGIGTWAAGGEIDLQLAHRSGWGGWLSAWGTSYRSQSLGTSGGQASWTRWVLGIGPVYERGREHWMFAAGAQAALAAFVVRGEGLPINRQDTAVDVGARLGVEAGYRWGTLAPVAGIAVVGWPRSRRVVAIGANQEQTLPKLELLLAAGFRWGRGP